MHKLSHQKKRNIGLVYEFIAREVTEAVVASDRIRAATALDIMSSHLSEGCTLYPELSLHRQVMETRGVSERLARRIVDELRAAGIRNSSKRKLHELAKTGLIHEINRTVGRGVFDRHRIPDYTAHASIGILMGRGAGGRLDEGVEIARVEDHLIGFLTGPATEGIRYNPDASLYAYRTAVGLFEAEFERELTGPQTDLLREYVRVSLGGNPAPFERTFNRQRGELREVLGHRRQDEVFKSDVEMSSRLDEAIADLATIPATVDDECVEKLLLYHNLCTEVTS